MSQRNRAAAQRWFEEVWNQGKLGVIPALLAPRVALHDMGLAVGVTSDPGEVAGIVRDFREAVPDIHFELGKLIAEGDRVAIPVTVTGTHTGPGLPIHPEGRRFSVSGVTIGRYEDGRIVEGWNHFDMLSFYEQLGALKRP